MGWVNILTEVKGGRGIIYRVNILTENRDGRVEV